MTMGGYGLPAGGAPVRTDQERAFLRAKVEFFEDVEEFASEELQTKAREVHDRFEASADLPTQGGALSFMLSQSVRDVEVRQQLLMSRSESERLRLLRLSPKQRERETYVVHMKEVAPRNGRQAWAEGSRGRRSDWLPSLSTPTTRCGRTTSSSNAFDRFAGHCALHARAAGVRPNWTRSTRQQPPPRLRLEELRPQSEAVFPEICGGLWARRLAFIDEIERDLLHHPMELIEGVEETLEYLNERHHLTLCTRRARAAGQAGA
jgi:hypothetical protein